MTYVCSDIHGRYDKYAALLAGLRFGPGDTLYVLGDVIDRGPQGVRVLLDMMNRPNVIPILGNHEFTAAVCLPWLLKEVTQESIAGLDEPRVGALGDWLVNGGEPTLQELGRLRQEERRAILDYILEMDLYAQVEAGGQSYLLVHAGLDRFSPDRDLEDYALEDFLFAGPESNALYRGRDFLVYGHTPTRLLFRQAGEAPQDRIFRRGQQIGIDCGCVFDGRLGALCLETGEEFYV